MQYTKPNEPGHPSQYDVNHPPPVAGTPVQAWATNVVPSPMAGAQIQPWTTELCGCCEDSDSCCLTFWCPCVTFGRIAHITDRGLTSCEGSGALCCFLCLCVGLQWIYTCIYRRNLRMLYNLPETPCCDCCVEYCCEWCSLCQMYRELQNRGINMSLGTSKNCVKGLYGYHQQNVQSLGQLNMQPPQGPGSMIR